jgi:hypothetical protein
MSKRKSSNGKSGRSHSRKRGVCPKCDTYGDLTHHHILPKRHWHGQGPGIKLCWDCHRELEDIIAKAEGKRHKKMSMRSYFRIISTFLYDADEKVINKIANQFAIQLAQAS